jgi:hypothetical protein
MFHSLHETISALDLVPFISAELESQGIPLVPSLTISTLQSPGSPAFIFDHSDLEKLFSYFGEVVSVSVKTKEASVVFKSINSAFFAQKALNNKFIQELNLTLTVSWGRVPLSKTVPKVDSLICIAEYKYTRKFLIDVDNCQEFQVSRRIIGPKGRNMKKIIEECTSQVKENHSVKLRLRGKGSGYKEGPAAEESEEPLHLCVSSKYLEIFTLACHAAEKLILTIYQEFDLFLIRKGISPAGLRLRILN